MTVTWDQIRNLPSGEFVGVAESVIDDAIAEACREVRSSRYGDRTDDAVKYLAAHLVAELMSGSRGPSGPVVSQQAGPVSQAYAAPAQSGELGLSSTSYGRRYLTIRTQVAGGPLVV